MIFNVATALLKDLFLLILLLASGTGAAKEDFKSKNSWMLCFGEEGNVCQKYSPI